MPSVSYTPLENHLGGGVYRTPLAGLFYLHRAIHVDRRGYFSELATIGTLNLFLKQPFVVRQINFAQSETNAMRGFHAEPWNKLVTITSGVAFCALADVRPDSPTFGLAVTVYLDATMYHPGSLFISAGIANSVCVVDGPVNYLYLVDMDYEHRDPIGDQAINLFDPDLDVHWPIEPAEAILSERDHQSVNLRQLFPEKF
jgi:dTDP-4-dehydrorhamnose 3,5-epimerase